MKKLILGLFLGLTLIGGVATAHDYGREVIVERQVVRDHDGHRNQNRQRVVRRVIVEDRYGNQRVVERVVVRDNYGRERVVERIVVERDRRDFRDRNRVRVEVERNRGRDVIVEREIVRPRRGFRLDLRFGR